jgi:phosphoribosyl-ATP pyrophosphohydrolase
VLYHVLVGLLSRGVSVRDVQAELARRFGVSGLDEKASRRG